MTDEETQYLEQRSRRDIFRDLHRSFDKLLAAYLVAHDGKTPSTTTCMELLEWSCQQMYLGLPDGDQPAERGPLPPVN